MSGEAGPYSIGVASVGPMKTVDGGRRDEMAGRLAGLSK